jgi:hypothetical protein
MRAHEREHTTCATVPGPRHRYCTCLHIIMMYVFEQNGADGLELGLVLDP